jgi:hypothetical protein
MFSDQSQQHRVGGEQDAPLLEEFAGAGEERRRLLQATRFVEDEAFQGFRLSRVEEGQLEVVTNASLMLRGGMLPGRVAGDLRLIDAQLERDEMEQLVTDLQGLLRRESVEESDEADLISKPQAVVVTATSGHLRSVGLGQGRFADHLSPGEGWQRHG